MAKTLVALNVDEISDSGVREAAQMLISLQTDASRLTNNLSNKVQSAQAEVEGLLNRLRETDGKLTTLLSQINTQTSVMTDALIQYQTSSLQNVSLGPKFTKSFSYVVKNVVSNLRQLVDALNKNAFAVGVSQTKQPSVTDEPTAQPQVRPAPETVLMSSPCFRSLEVLGNVVSQKRVYRVSRKLFAESSIETLKDIEENARSLFPILSQSDAVISRNEELLQDLNEVMSAVGLAQAPTAPAPTEFQPKPVPQAPEVTSEGSELDTEVKPSTEGEEAPVEPEETEEAPEEETEEPVEEKEETPEKET